MPTMHWRDAEREAARRRRSPTKRKASFVKDALNPANQQDGKSGSPTTPLADVRSVDKDWRTEAASPPEAMSSPGATTAAHSSPERTPAYIEKNRPVYTTDDTVTGPSASDEDDRERSDGVPILGRNTKQLSSDSAKVLKKRSLISARSDPAATITTPDATESLRRDRLLKFRDSVANSKSDSVGPEVSSSDDEEGAEELYDRGTQLLSARSDGGSSVDYNERVELDEEEDKMVDVIQRWQKKVFEQRADRVRRSCSNCDTCHAAWYCHGCDYNYCETCNRDTHHTLCANFRQNDHVLQRLDGKALRCGRCTKGIWDIFAHGYDSFHDHYSKKKRRMMRERMKEEMIPVKEEVETTRHAMKKERKGNRLRQAQQEKLAEMLRVGKQQVHERVSAEVNAHFAPMIEPLRFDPSQITLQRGDNGRPILPPPKDETGRYVAMFSFDFERNCVLCRACSIYWNSGPSCVNKRVILNAYAPVGPQLDPMAAARNTVKAIRQAKKRAAMLEKLKAMARKKEPPKSKMCVLL